MRFFVQNALGGLAYGGLLFMVASGLTLVFGLMRVINIAQTSFYLIGAYIGLSLIRGGAEKVTVLHHGSVVADGGADEVRADPKVQEVYLGNLA